MFMPKLMKTSVTFGRSLIAPCGMNCGTCIAYLRDRNKCAGCRLITKDNSVTRMVCIVRNCTSLRETSSQFCYECEKFPCKRIKQLDKRYRTKYRTSFIQNLETIKEFGITAFLSNEAIRWTCPGCGSVLCCHREKCLVCNRDFKEIEN
jgi:hypothetical protein